MSAPLETLNDPALPDDDASPDFELPNFDLSRLSSRSSLQS